MIYGSPPAFGLIIYGKLGFRCLISACVAAQYDLRDCVPGDQQQRSRTCTNVSSIVLSVPPSGGWRRGCSAHS